MKLRMHENLRVASKVLSLVNKIGVARLNGDDCWIESYSNGREQGYAIKVWPRHASFATWLCFSEFRCSDDIVVYEGPHFSVQGNIPTQQAKDAAKFFPHDKQEKAAAYIVKRIKALLKLSRSKKAKVA